MICVVGSGPAGISAAFALVKSGHKVLMLDVGLTLEPEIQAAVSMMAGVDKSVWQPADLAKVRKNMEATYSGIPLKYIFGSDFPYRDAEAGIGLFRRHAEIRPSFARGGLSNVWGAALLPVCGSDISDWPVSVKDLAPHYLALNEFMPMAGRCDDLEKVFPLYGNPCEMPASRQAIQLMQDLSGSPAPHLRFGQSRLAVKKGCVACGLCMYGCPYGLIYNSSETLSYLCSQPHFSYQTATVVRRLEEKKGQVIIGAVQEDKSVEIRADAVFIAAGTLSSTRIILESLDAFDHPLPLKNSQYFFFPLLRYKRTAGVQSEELHTLAQFFLELSDPELSPFTIHLQCYTYNDLYPGAIRKALGSLAGTVPLGSLLERLLLIQGYLHSDLTAPMIITLRRNGLELLGQPNPNVSATVRGVMKKLGRIGLSFSPTIGLPGQGFHAGGSLPMRKAPAPFETDVWGRPYGFKRVHVVDASVLPSIPATTITYTAMANAHRIATGYSSQPVQAKKTKRCAITGANGYVGSAIASFLRKQGFEVIPLVRRPLGAERAYSLEGPVSQETLKGVDLLVHAAYDFSIINVDELRRINIDGSERLFASAQKADVRRTVFISSLSAFEGCRSAYGRTKLAIEGLAQKYGVSVVRPGLVFGERSGGMVKALKRLAALKVIPLISSGNQPLYLAHEEDLGLLIYNILTMQGHIPERPIAAANPQHLTLREIISAFSGSSPVFLPVPGGMVLACLRLFEAFGHTSRLRSDSLISLLTPAPPPDFSGIEAAGVVFRPFLSWQKKSSLQHIS